MVCYCLDLRSDSAGAKFLSHKFVSVIVGVIQVLMWVSALFAFIVQPGVVKEQIQSSPAGAIAFAVILVLVCIGFSVLLLIGLLKDRTSYIQAYLVFIVVLIVTMILSILVNIFTQPRKFGVSGFLSSVITTLLDILTYFVVRNYYLAFISTAQNQNQARNKV